MDSVERMQIVEASEHFATNGSDLGLREFANGKHLRERPPVHVLHADPECAVPHVAAVVLHNVGVRARSHHANLMLHRAEQEAKR